MTTEKKAKGNKLGNQKRTAPLSAETAKSILSSLKGDNDKKSLLLFGLGFYTGFRIGDILNLTWNDVRGEKIETKEQKTSKRRLVTINTELQKIVKFCDNGQDGENFIFVGERHHTGEPMTVAGAIKRIKLVFERYGIETENPSSHTLRKTFAYEVFLRLGGDVEAYNEVRKTLSHGAEDSVYTYLSNKGFEDAENNDWQSVIPLLYSTEEPVKDENLFKDFQEEEISELENEPEPKIEPDFNLQKEIKKVKSKNYEVIESLKKQGFSISHATFYRLKKLGLFSDNSSENQIKEVLQKIDNLKKSKSIATLATP